MNALLCKIFGHIYSETPIVLSLRIMPEGGQWQEITHAAQTTICRRCGFLPVRPEVVIGTQNANVGFTPNYSVDGFGIFLGEENVLKHQAASRPRIENANLVFDNPKTIPHHQVSGTVYDPPDK